MSIMNSGIDGVDNLLEEDNFVPTQETFEKVVHSIMRVYAEILIDREDRGVTSTVFSRREYLKRRKPDDPSLFMIKKTIGDWNTVKRLLPIQENEKSGRITPASQGISYENLWKALKTISAEHKKPVHKITSREFTAYKNEHPDVEIYDWQTYATQLGYGRKWKLLVNNTIQYAYRHDL